MKKINFAKLSNEIAKIGRDINLDTIVQTKQLITPLYDGVTSLDVDICKDISYGDDSRHRLDVFTPAAQKNANLPLLIFVHGGGFVAGDKGAPDSPFYQNIGIWAVRNGFNAINMTYRLAPKNQWPSGVEDIHQVIQWVRQHGAEHGLGDSKIVLMGQSAGAVHAASYLAHPEIYAPEDHGLAGIVLLSGAYDFTTMRVSELERAYLGDDETCYEERSSIAGLLASDLPILVTASEYDPDFFEAQALQLLTALQKKNNKIPRFVHMIGQNHISAGLTLGLEGDLLAPQLSKFIVDI